MKILENHPAYKKAREEYGFEFELDMLVEECTELIMAVSKMKRANLKDESLIEVTANFAEEVGDVENLLQQMKHWVPEFEEAVNEIRVKKLDRLERRVDEQIKNGSA